MIAGVLVLVATVPANPLALATLTSETPGAIQEVTPLPSVFNRYPFVPALVGNVSDQVPAATAVFIVTAPEVDPLRTIDALVPPAEPIVNKSEVGAVPIPRAVVILALPVTSNTYEGAFVPIPTLPVAVILIRSVSVVSKCI